MQEPNPPSRHYQPARVPVLMGLFAGTAVGGGYLLAGIPNVEVMSLVVALAGVALGAARGSVVGALAAGVFSLGSPYGLPAPLLLAAQMAGLASAGAIGSVAGRAVATCFPIRRSWPAAALAGLVVTVVYDGLTNLAIMGSFELAPAVVLAGSVPFFLVHAASNLALFTLLFPALAPRLAGLGRPRVTGGPGVAAALVLLLGLAAPGGPAAAGEPQPAAVAGPDSAAASHAQPAAVADSAATAPAAATPPPSPLGWRRALWQPFTPTYLDWAGRDSPWLAYVDGGVGAAARLVGEGGASSQPLVVRDGVPLGTGHALADDPWFVGREGQVLAAGGLGADGWGGTAGLVELSPRDGEPERATSSYRGVKGRHESYYRGVEFLTPRADWRLGFSFEESLDNEGYNHTLEADDLFALRREDGFTGQGKVRQSRTRVERLLPRGALSVEFGTGRRTRDELPALDAGRLEAWDRNAAVRMRWQAGGWEVRPVLFWNERDVLWGSRWTDATPPPGARLLESGRQGLRLDVARAPRLAVGAPAAAGPDSAGPAPASPPSGGLPVLTLTAVSWTLRDEGTRAAWAGADTLPVTADGGELRAALGWERQLGGATAQVELAALGGDGLGLAPDARLALAATGPAPRWSAALEWGGRAPRSDELWTPLRYSVAGSGLAALPNAGLGREKSLRAQAQARATAAGVDLALGASVRRLADGITWVADEGDPDSGRWRNNLEMTAWRLTAGAAREGRLLGWVRLKAEGTWQGYDIASGHAGPLPPEQWQRLRVDWENHFFQEDGILQLSLVSTRRGPGSDPWDLTGDLLLPARINHDLLLGFRLAGAHLVLGLRNLAGERQRLTSGALSPGQEMDMRLEWAFSQ